MKLLHLANILVLEDDKFLRNTLQIILKNKKYAVDLAASLQEAYDFLEKHSYDLVVLDRVLPDGDSLELIAYLDERFYFTKILVLTQKHSLQEKINSFESGVDDYLTKPFEKEELILRVKSLLKKIKIKPHKEYQLKDQDLIFIPSKGELKVGQKIYYLRNKETQILIYLIRRKNRIVSREELIYHLWPVADVPSYKTIDVYIRRIRMKMKPYGYLIRTYRKFGYKLLL